MFMIRDLAESPGPVQELFADVLVIGAGIAGLLTAVRLARAGRKSSWWSPEVWSNKARNTR